MTHDEFVGQVQARARLESSATAETAIRATLETLAERLEAGAAGHLAAQLPTDIARHLRGDHATTFERMALDDFYKRVCSREARGTDLPRSVFHVRVVLDVLQEAVSRAVIEKVRVTLPPEFRPIFDSGSRGQRNGDERPESNG